MLYITSLRRPAANRWLARVYFFANTVAKSRRTPFDDDGTVEPRSTTIDLKATLGTINPHLFAERGSALHFYSKKTNCACCPSAVCTNNRYIPAAKCAVFKSTDTAFVGVVSNCNAP